MTVIIHLSSGETYRLDRNLGISQVAEQINAARGNGCLVEFPNDATPSRVIYVDPDLVTSIHNNGYPY